MSSSLFNQVPEASTDPIFQLAVAFAEDPRPHKVNLSVGLYRDEKLQTPILKAVKTAEKYLLAHETTKEYLPISGDPLYIEKSGRLILGDKLWDQHHSRICGIQTPGGTGALRIAAEFMRQFVSDHIAIPDPTWPNHLGIFNRCGYQIHAYPYYDLATHHSAIQAILDTLKKIPARSIVLFHACCHNPTGADLTEKEWDDVFHVVQKRKLLPLFDLAYQGLAKGIEQDPYVIRKLLERSMDGVVAFSYSKNFGLYSERVGGLFAITPSAAIAEHVLSQLKIFARTNYSNPPKHGAAIVTHILSTPELKKEWIQEVDKMRDRLNHLRKEFVASLQKGPSPIDFSHLLDQVGMFCFLGLSKDKVERLREEYGIYMTSDGRMNLAGL